MQIPCSLIFKSYLAFTQSGLEKTFSSLYPRIFSIHNLDIYSEDCPGRAVPEDQWSAAILPKNLTASSKSIEESGVYLVDSGEQFLVGVHPQAEDSAIQSVAWLHADIRSREHHRPAADLRSRGARRQRL